MRSRPSDDTLYTNTVISVKTQHLNKSIISRNLLTCFFSDMISKPDFLPFYKEENSSLIEDPFAEKSKSCNEEPEETKECNHTNR